MCRGPDNIKDAVVSYTCPRLCDVSGPAKKIPLMCQSYAVQEAKKDQGSLKLKTDFS